MENTLITEEYRLLNEELHASSNFGANARRAVPNMHGMPDFFKKYGIETVLDFGCGQGGVTKYMNKKMGLKAEGYDPCVDQFKQMPEGTFDAVISIDVFEHIEPEFLEETLKLVDSKFTKAAYLNICTRQAKAQFSNGVHTHTIVEGYDWWVDKITENMDVKIGDHFWNGKDNKNLNLIVYR